MWQSAMPGTQNDMTTCLETFETKKFCSFPHRHGDATGKPETRDKTRGSSKTIISCETSSNFHSLKHAERTCFAASPIDTAKPPENQWPETRQVGALKRAFRARLPPIFTLCSFKINVFLRVFVGTSKFCNIKIDVSCEASINFQHMSQNATPTTEFAPCRHLTQPCQCDLQKTRNATRVKCCACHAKMTMDTSKVLRLPTKTATHLLKTSQSIARLPHKNDFPHVAKLNHVWMSQSCHAWPRETKQRDVWNRQKWYLLQNLP